MNRSNSGRRPGPVADTDTYDGATSNLVELANDDILLFYHQNDAEHIAPDGRIVQRRSTDFGQTWSEPKRIHDEPEKDAAAPSAIYSADANRIVLFDIVAEFPGTPDFESKPERRNFDTKKLVSGDGGRTWSDPTSISNDLESGPAVPFGGGARTRRGLLTAFGSRDWQIETMLSNDGGASWGSNAVVDSPPGRKLCEPVPCPITDERIIIYGRDNETADFFAIRSSDGGRSWSHPVFFNPAENSSPTPIWVQKTGRNELTAVYADRDDQFLYTLTTSAGLAWQDPTTLAEESRNRLHQHVGTAETSSYWDGDAGDFGYPTFIQLGSEPSDILVTFYDEAGRPNIWQTYLY